MKKIITLILSIAMLLSVTACGGGKDNNSSSTPEKNKVDVWSTYSTAKVLFDSALNGNYINLGNQLEVCLSKGESEMGQIVITAKDAISFYDVKVSDLKCGEEVLKKENIEVYHQKPINVVSKTTGNYNEKFPKGLTPDCLLPLSVAKEFEENKINANSNQPISFEVTAPINQKAGTYKGEFEVVADDFSTKVPVEVTVWNYVAPQNMYGKTCMLIYQSELFYGEMDSSDEMYTRYFEELLKNKMNAWHVPYTATSPEKMVDSVIKYWDYPNFNSFGMPDLILNDDVNYARQKEYLLELGRRSTEDRILFDKAYFYHTVIDEPHAFPEKHAKVTTIINNVNNLLKDVLAQLEGEGMFEGKEQFKIDMEKSLENMTQIVTSPYDKEFDGSNLTYCPPIQYMDKVKEREELSAHSQRENVENWTYTCNNPTYPYPSTHIDDYLIGSRIMKWMQKAYDVKGYLSWSVNHYSKVVPFTHKREEINPYVDPQRVLGPGAVANGDGYLFYPGKKYNSQTPFTSIRMKSLRDGQDDYDALCLLEELYNEFDEFYGANGEINSDNILSYVYNRMFSGTIYNSDDVFFDESRKLVAQMIENASLDEKLVFNTTEDQNGLNVTLYLNKGYNLSLNGENLVGVASGNGMKYSKTIPLSAVNGKMKVVVSKDDYSKEYKFNVNKTNVAVDFAKDGASKFDVPKYNSLVAKDGVAQVIINSVDRGDNAANIRFATGITLKLSAFAHSLNDIENIYFDVTNNGNKDCEFKIYFTANGQRKEFSQVRVKSHSKTRVQLLRVYDFGMDLTKADGIFLAFENAYMEGGKAVLYDSRNLSIENILYVIK